MTNPAPEGPVRAGVPPQDGRAGVHAGAVRYLTSIAPSGPERRRAFAALLNTMTRKAAS